MTTPHYLAGIAAAIGSGLAFNTGLFLQQYAVKRLPPGIRVFPGVLRLRIWLAGSGLQAILAMPLNIIATGLIGPALTPCLIAVGLGVLPLAAATVERTHIGPRAIAGIAAVMLSAVCIGLSRLSVEMTPSMVTDVSLLLRSILLIGPAILAAVVLGLLGSHTRGDSPLRGVSPEKSQKSRTRGDSPLRGVSPEKSQKGPRAGYLLTLSAGFWLGITAPAVGFMTAALRRLPQGVDTPVIVVGGLALAIAVVGSVLGIGTTQQAFRHGSAHVLIPIQYLPLQLIPVLSFFLVFRPFTPPLVSVLLAIAGITGIALGAGLLTSSAAK